MDLEHSFTVPVDVETAWAEFQDIGSVAECFPGAQVTSVEGDTFSGSVKVKLGPIAMVYNGSARSPRGTRSSTGSLWTRKARTSAATGPPARPSRSP